MAAAAAAVAAMPPEPSLNLGSPRTRAAMKVLGVLPQEVHKLDPARFAGEEARYKLLEQKRRHLIEEVLAMASKGLEAPGKKPGDEGQARAEANAAFLKEVERVEKENMERMQKMAKKDVQKVVIQELETKLNSQKGQKKQEESHARLLQLLKARDDQLAAQKKQAAKRQEKNQEVRGRALHARAEKSAELADSLRKSSERAETKIAEIAAGHQEARAKNEERRVHIFERQEGYEKELLKGRETAYEELCVKHQAKLDKLAEALIQRQSNAEAIAEKQQKSMETVRVHQEMKQAEAEKKFWEICGRHESAAKIREDNLSKVVKDYQVRSTKRRAAHSSRYEKLVEEWEKEPGMKLCASSAPGSPHFVQQRAEVRRSSPKIGGAGEGGMARSSSDSKLLEVTEHRRHLVDVVSANRERLRRAHHFAVEQQLDKLDHMRKKIQIMEDAKTEADRRRMVVMRNCAVEKMHLTERVDRIKDSQDPEKMNRMLEDLDPDPEAVTRINDLLGGLGRERLGGFREEGEEAK